MTLLSQPSLSSDFCRFPTYGSIVAEFAADVSPFLSFHAADEDAFAGTAARVVYVPDGCEAIGSRAFRGCEELKSIRIPENCALGEQVFDGCGTVCVYARPGSAAESYCAGKEGLIFVPWTE